MLIQCDNLSEGIPVPSQATIEVFALRSGDGVGTTRDYFAPVITHRTIERYCHAEMALQTEIGLPVTSSYEGAKTRSGCS
jgi:hypothetical protein